MVENILKSKNESRIGSALKVDESAKMLIGLFELVAKHPGGDVSMVQLDGTILPPFDGGKCIIEHWAIALDLNDNVWIANEFGHSITQLFGARQENCPPGTKTGDPISLLGGYIGGLQIAIG